MGRQSRSGSDRLSRLARIVALAEDYLGDPERAARWLKRPNQALGVAYRLNSSIPKPEREPWKTLLAALPTAE